MFSIIRLIYFGFVITNLQYGIVSSSPPKHWLQHVTAPHASHQVFFYFYLKQSNSHQLNYHLHIRGNPDHHLYHQTSWLTLDQLTEIVRPDSISIQV